VFEGKAEALIEIVEVGTGPRFGHIVAEQGRHPVEAAAAMVGAARTKLKDDLDCRVTRVHGQDPAAASA